MTTHERPAAVVVLAAGEGTRMRSAAPKVLHEVCGRTLLGHVVAAARALQPEHLVVVVGHAREQVTAHLAEVDPDAVAVVQEEQNGTGHAVRVALDALPELHGTVVVVPGDAPLLRAETLRDLVVRHGEDATAATLLTAVLPDATGYGRVVRGPHGAVVGVVEHRDATAEQLAVREVNTSVYAFASGHLRRSLHRLSTDNSQGEEYLTDVVGLLVDDGLPVGAVVADEAADTAGVNDRVQLAEARAALRDRLVRAAQRAGADVVDPATTWLDVGVELGRDCTVLPGTSLLGRTRLADGAVVGPHASLRDTTVAEGATVTASTCVGAEVGPGASVGPYSYLRPGTRLGRGAKVGAFVETKAADIGDDAKVPHLSYVGDAEIGEGTNVGAATVVVNYDGQRKHRTVVGRHARIGSDTMLVAPVTVGDGAYTAAGSVVTGDVPPGALAVARGRQRVVDGWVARRRPGTPSAEAAEAADAAAPAPQEPADDARESAP